MAEIKLDQDTVFGDKHRGSDAQYVQGILGVTQKREGARERIALLIVGALLLIVASAFLALCLLIFSTNSPVHFSDLKDLTEVLVAPVVGIVGAVTGFYFGEKTSERQHPK